MGLRILQEKSEYLLCYKPAGMPTQTKDIRKKDLMDELRARFPKEELSVINRLDQPVEGIVLVARGKKHAATLSAALQSSRCTKEYLCVVEGSPEKTEATLTDYIESDSRTNLSHIVSEACAKNNPNAKKASLTYRVLARGKDTALVQVLLLTGRHHQIRVQMAHAGFPLVGDRKYGPNATGASKVALCAFRLSFTGELALREEIRPESEAFQEYAGVLVDKIPQFS